MHQVWMSFTCNCGNMHSSNIFNKNNAEIRAEAIKPILHMLRAYIDSVHTPKIVLFV